MRTFQRNWIAASLSLLIAVNHSTALLAAESLSPNPDTHKLQRVISFNPNAPAQKADEKPQDEIPYQSFGLQEENPLQPADADSFDPGPIIQEMQDLNAEIPGVNKRIQYLSAGFQQLVTDLESKSPEDTALLENIKKAAAVYEEVKTVLEEKMSWIDPEGLIQRMDEIAQSEEGITAGDIEQFHFERDIFKQWFEEIRFQVKYYEDEFDYAKSEAEGTSEIWTRCESILNQIRETALNISEGLEDKKDGFSEFIQSKNVFLSNTSKNIQTQIGDMQLAIAKRVAEAEAVFNALLVSQNARGGEELVTSQLELIREMLSEINGYSYSVQHYAEELIVYQDYDRQFDQILETALAISPSLDAEFSKAAEQLAAVKMNFESLIRSPNIFIGETAKRLTSEIDKVLKQGPPELSLKEIYASQGIPEAFYHLEHLQDSAQRYADELSKSIKYYQNEFANYSRFNEQFKPLLKKVTDSIKNIESRTSGLQERYKILFQNFSALLKQNPEFPEISALIKAIEGDQKGMKSDLEESIKLLDKIKHATSMGEASPMALLIQELEKRFEPQGFYMKQIQIKEREYLDYQALIRPLTQARQEMAALRAVLEPLRDKILEILAELEDPKRVPPSVQKSLSTTLKEWKALASEIDGTLKELQGGLDTALALRDLNAIKAQSQKIKTAGALKTAQYQARYNILRQRILLTLLLSGVFFKDWYLIIRLLS